jgi:hypothetical protein
MTFPKILIALIIGFSTSAFSQSRIAYFNAIALKDSVRLNFTISPGISCNGYQVLKGSDSVNLYTQYIYPGICGNSNYAEPFTYFDVSPNKVTANYYRILIPPGDYSNIIRVDIASAFTNMLIYPQPAETELNIAINNKKNFSYEIRIINRFGVTMGIANGYCGNKITLNIESIPLGVYVFYIIDQDGNAYRGRFLKS